MQTTEFSEIVWDFYAKHGRELPWRTPEADGTFDPYKILVSELMLQQTQVSRVVTKYHEFLQAFPTITDLANASLGDVLRQWSGLGYNRRAKFLWQAAGKIAQDFSGVFPRTQKELTSLPGVGVNTAGAICAYAFNQPVAFVETNIRTVYIHHFFVDRTDVHDNELTPVIEQTVDTENPREWYWALMDYGSHLKATLGNISRNSKHHTKQSKFEGSKRQVRGAVIRALRDSAKTMAELKAVVADDRLTEVLSDLAQEGLIVIDSKGYRLA